ncbi:MAG: energy transducer TonB [Candidatus Kryptoniota bacterium]
MAEKKAVKAAEEKIQYGAPTLKRVARKYTSIALIIAVALHFVGIGAYWGYQYLNNEDENETMIRVLKYSELGPPPSITNQEALPQVAISEPLAKPDVGVPVPVPDAEVSPEQTIATQQELSKIAGPANLGGDSGAVAVSDSSFKVSNDDTPPPDFVPVEKEPQVVRQVTPKYPELAQRAGIEGRVYVKIWVDKEGKPRKAVVLKSDAEIFDQPSVNAAMQYLFTPAIMNKGPVAVWYVVPFTFKLQPKH